jgi:hypothetical protein
MNAEFQYDVFLSHSAKDKAVVRPLAERLRRDESELQPFLRAFGSDWAQLEAGTCGRRNLRFRDPLNQERRFIPLRLADPRRTCLETCGRPRIHRQSRI